MLCLPFILFGQDALFSHELYGPTRFLEEILAFVYWSPFNKRQENIVCITINARPISKSSVQLGGSCFLESNRGVANLQQRRRIVRSTTNQPAINKIGNSSVRTAGVTPLERNGAPFINVPQKQGAKVAKRRLSNVFPVKSLVSTSIRSVQTRSLLQK